MPDVVVEKPTAPGHSSAVPLAPESRAQGTPPVAVPRSARDAAGGSSAEQLPVASEAASAPIGARLRGLWRRLRPRERNEAVREVIEELIEETSESGEPISDDQRVLLANIIKLRDRTVADVMVPRVDIVAIQADTALDDVVKMIQREAHSRYPVFRESLDDVIGMVHIKDVLAYWGTGKRFNLRDILRRVVFVAPTMSVLDMMLDMRKARTHMALVVDEFGGTDGVLTIEDLVEEIVGEIEDEHDIAEVAPIVQRPDGTYEANGRVSIAAFEDICGRILTEDERATVDTLGGLIFSLLGRIPERGEVVRHSSGTEFEILGVDPRRIRRLRIRSAPAASVGQSGSAES